MYIQKCPKCRSANIDWSASTLTGISVCQNCGYTGAIFLEEEVRETKKKKKITSPGK